MNENINLCEILKGHEGETFYSPLFGENVKLYSVGPANGNGLINVQRTGKIQNGVITSFMDDGSYIKGGEIQLYPSKDQRDWNKWIEEQKPKIPKTWSELVNQNKVRSLKVQTDVIIKEDLTIEDDSFTEKETPIEKSALALLKIHQLIEVGYGGNVSNKIWHTDKSKYGIEYINGAFAITTVYCTKNLIAFHTEKQAQEFLTYPENVQLLKDYFMI